MRPLNYMPNVPMCQIFLLANMPCNVMCQCAYMPNFLSFYNFYHSFPRTHEQSYVMFCHMHLGEGGK